MAIRISDASIRGALALLEDLRDPSWLDVSWELQDGATNVLFVVNISGMSQPTIDARYAQPITARFDQLFPAEEIVWVTNFNDVNGIIASYCGPSAR